jgi:hypothetical protein
MTENELSHQISAVQLTFIKRLDQVSLNPFMKLHLPMI